MPIIPLDLGGGSSSNPSEGLNEGQVPKADGLGKFSYSGATVDPITGEWTFDSSINVPQASLKISDVVTISEATFTPIIRDNVLQTNSINAAAVIDDSGSGPLTFLAATNKQTIEAQPVSDTEFTANPFTAALLATLTNQTDAVTVRTGTAMTNVRITITDNLTGVIVKYIPNKASVDSGEGGLDFRAGDNRVDFNSSLDDDPANGLFYLGNTPLRQFAGEASTFRLEADNVSLLGNSGGTPYFKNEIQFIQPKTVPFTEDITHTADNFMRLNTDSTDLTSTHGGLAVVTKIAGVSDSVTVAQFEAGVVGVSAPTLITDGSSTFSTNDLVQISNSKFNNLFVEVESHVGTLLTIRGVGGTPTVESFTSDNLTSALDSATLEKIFVSAIQANDLGRFEQATGSETPLTYTELHDNLAKPTFIEAIMSIDMTYDTSLEEKIVLFDTPTKANGITLGTNGEFEVSLEGHYEGHLILQVNETSDPVIFVWLEVKPAATGVWELSGGMARTKFKEDTSWTLTLDGSLDLEAGDKVRVLMMMQGVGSDKFVLEGISKNVSLGTLVQPSASIEILRTGSLV